MRDRTLGSIATNIEWMMSKQKDHDIKFDKIAEDLHTVNKRFESGSLKIDKLKTNQAWLFKWLTGVTAAIAGILGYLKFAVG